MEIRVFRALPGSFDSLLPRELRWPEDSGQIIFQEMSDEATVSPASAWLRPYLYLLHLRATRPSKPDVRLIIIILVHIWKIIINVFV